MRSFNERLTYAPSGDSREFKRNVLRAHAQREQALQASEILRRSTFYFPVSPIFASVPYKRVKTRSYCF